MADRKGKPAPPVQVIRRPAAAGDPAPPAASTGNASPPTTSVPVRPASSSRPEPSGHRSAGTSLRPAPRPGSGPPSDSSGRAARFRPSGPPRPPPTADQIQALAKRERVPNRIARGELEGKMKCRVWKKLHAEEARRFDQAHELAEHTPGLSLADAFGVVQSGMSVEEFTLRRAKSKKKEEVKQARASVQGQPIDAVLEGWRTSGTELCVVLAERTVIDGIKSIQPVALELERAGRLEKLQVVLIARKATWETLGPTTERDPKLAQKPAGVARQPTRRPVSDPRQFLGHLGETLRLTLRNGIILSQPLLAVGPYDLLLGPSGEELFVPLHALLSWNAGAA